MKLDFSSVQTAKVDPSNRVQLDFSSVTPYAQHAITTSNTVNTDDYSKYVKEVHPEFGTENLNAERALGQSSGEQFGAFLNQAVVGEMVGGTIESIGFLGDIGDAAKVIAGEDVELGNMFTRLGGSVRDWSKEATPIYETDPGKFAPGNFSWWMANGSSAASMVALAIPATGVIKGLGMVGKAVNATSKLTKIGKEIGMSAKALEIAAKAAPGVGQAIVSRQGESLLEASGKWQEIYKRDIEAGRTEEEAIHNASAAAHQIYSKNWVMLAQDIPQYLLLGKAFGKAAKKLTPGMAKGVINPENAKGVMPHSIGRLKLNKGTKYALNAVGEGGEEAYQYAVAESADELAKKRVNPDYEIKGLKEFVKEDEFWTSAAMGMIGAGVFQAGGTAINKAFGLKEADTDAVENIATHGPVMKLYAQAMKEADAVGDVQGYEEARLGLISSLAGNSLQKGTVDVLLHNLEQILEQEATPEALKKYGFDQEDVGYIKETFPTLIAEVEKIKESYEAYISGSIDNTVYSPKVAATLATLESDTRRLYARKENVKKELVGITSQLVESGYNEVSTFGKSIKYIEAQLVGLKQAQHFIKEKQKDKEASKEEQSFYSKKIKEINSNIEELATKKESYKKSDKYTKEERKADNKVNLNASLLAKAGSLNASLSFIDLSISKKKDTVNSIKSKKDVEKKKNISKGTAPSVPSATKEKTPKTPLETKESTSKLFDDNGDLNEGVFNETKESKKRQGALNIDNINQLKKAYDSFTLSEFFDEFGEVDVAFENVKNTGVLSKKNGKLIVKLDNTGKAVDLSKYLDSTIKESPITILSVGRGKPEVLKTTSKDPTPTIEHPDSDKEEGTKTTKKIDSLTESKGETKVFYTFDTSGELNDFLNDPSKKINDAIGEYFIDYDNPFMPTDLEKLAKLKKGDLGELDVKFLDRISIGIKLSYKGKAIKGTLYLPGGDKVSSESLNKKEDIAKGRAFRTSILKALIQGKATTTSLRQDSGHVYLNKKGTQKNLTKALDLDLQDIHLGISLRGGLVYNSLDNKLPFLGNYHGGNIYYISKNNPLKEARGVKLNKTKVSKVHASIILKAFEQSLKGWRVAYEGTEVEGNISVAQLLSLLVNNGDSTIVTSDVKKALKDPEYAQRLEQNQLYRKKNILHYGIDGTIDLKSITAEDIDAFTEHITSNINYPIRISELNKTVPSITIGGMVLDGKMTYEHHYIKNGFITTDIAPDKFGNDINSTHVYTDMSVKVEVKEVKEKEVNSVIEQVEKKDKSKTAEESSPKSLEDVFKKYRPHYSKAYNGQLYLRESVNRQIEDIRSVVGKNVSIEVVDSLIKVIGETGSGLAFGQVKDASITLYERAEAGTGYHEAFHIVSLYYLTDRQRKVIYDEAAAFFKLDRKDERALEEALAESFQSFMLTEKEVAPKSNILKSFFRKLYDFILDIFVKPESRVSDLTISKLFDNMENGKFKAAKVKNKNLKKYSGRDYLRKVEGFSTAQTQSVTDQLLYQMLTRNNITSLEDVEKLSLDPVMQFVKGYKKDLDSVRSLPNISEVDKVESERLFNVFNKIEENFGEFAELIGDRLFAMNINRQVNSFEDTSGIDIHNLFIEDNNHTDGTDILSYDKASYEVGGKHNLLANVKLFIATLPASEEVDAFTGLNKMTSFSESYAKVMLDLHDAVSFEDILSRVTQKAKTSVYYKILLNGDKNTGRIGLKDAPILFQRQFEIAVKKHRHTFANISTDVSGNMVFVDAAVSKAENEIAYEWSLNFYLSGIFIKEDDTIYSHKIAKRIQLFEDEIRDPANKEFVRGNVYSNYSNYVGKISRLLTNVGIALTEKDINNIITSLGTDEKSAVNLNIGLDTLITDILSKMFSTKGVFGELKSGAYDTNKVKAEDLIAKDSVVRKLAKEALNQNKYLLDDTVLGAAGATYYVYAQPSLLTDTVRDLKEGSTLLQEYQSVEENKHSRFLEQIAAGKEIELITFSSLRAEGKEAAEYTEITSQADFLFKMNAFSKNLIPLPTLADRKSYYLYKGMDTISLNDFYVKEGQYTLPDSVIDIFYNYAKSEQIRIEKVSQKIKAAMDAAKSATNETDRIDAYEGLIKNRHYKNIKPDGTPVLTLDRDSEDAPQGLKYSHFTDFNKKELSRDAVKQALDSNILDTVLYAEKLGIIKINRDKNGNIKHILSKLIGNKLVDSATVKTGDRSLAIYHILAEYTLNTISSTIETEVIFSGDPSYYKSLEDKIKRLNAVVAPGEALIEDINGISTYKSITINSLIFKDSPLISLLKPMFKTAYLKIHPNASDAEVQKAVDIRIKPYEKVDVTDAQVMVTPSAYKDLSIRMGTWTKEYEAAYRVIMQESSTKEDKLKATALVAHPLKLVHFGHYFNNNESVPLYDKMSVAAMWPDLVKGTHMEPLYNHMISEGVDMVKYDSAVKVGIGNNVRYFDENTGEAIPEHLDNLRPATQSFKHLRKQQVTDPHGTDTRTLATQVKKAVMGNLRMGDSIYTVRGMKEKITGREIASMFSKVYSAMSSIGKKKVIESLGIDNLGKVDKSKLWDKLRKDALESNKPYNIVDSLFVDNNGNVGIELDTLLSRNWTESKMLSSVTKYTIDTVLPGTDLIQTSGGGLDKLSSKRLDLIDSEGRTEIKLSVSVFKGLIPNYSSLTFEEKVAFVEKNIVKGVDGIGYRIPTQGQNSVIPFIIKEFLPERYGNTIILPYGFTTLTGSDFDIDKLFIARYNYINKGGELQKYTFIEGNSSDIIEDEQTLESLWKINVYSQLVHRDSLVELKSYVDALVKQDVSKKTALLKAWDVSLSTETKVNIAEEVGVAEISNRELTRLGSKLTYDKLESTINKLNKLDDLKSYIKKNTGKNAYDLNHPKAVENRILDLMFAVMTNKEHTLETKTPLDTFTGKLKDIASKVQDKEPLGMLAAASPAYQLQVKDWYIGGGKGIAPFALHNVHHVLTQIAGYSIGGFDLGKSIGNDKVSILDWLSALINANVDIAKDPYIFHLNVNEITYPIVNFMIRAGFGEQTFWFLNQESIKELIKSPKGNEATIINNYENKARKAAYTQQTTSLVKNALNAEINEIIDKYSNPNYLYKVNNFNSDINREDKDYKYYARQAGLVTAYGRLDSYGAELDGVLKLSKIDGKGFGNTLLDIATYKKSYEKKFKSNRQFKNLVESTFIHNMYKNTIPFILEMYEELTIDGTAGFSKIMDSMTEGATVKETKQIANAIYASIISMYFSSEKGLNLKKEDIKALFIGKKSLGYRVRNLANTFPELKDNKLIDTLKPVLDKSTGIWYVKSISGDKNDKFLRDIYTESWAELLEHPSSEVKKLAEDLVIYSFYTSGFNRSLYSFYQDMPIDYLKKKPTHNDSSLVSSYDEFIKEQLQILNNPYTSEEYLTKIRNDAMSILSDESVASFNGKSNVLVDSDNVPVMVMTQANDSLLLGENSSGLPINQEYIKVTEGGVSLLLQYVGYKKNSKEAVYRVIPSKNIGYKGHKILELGYEGSLLDESVKSLDLNYFKELNTAEGFEDFVYIDNKEIAFTKEVIALADSSIFTKDNKKAAGLIQGIGEFQIEESLVADSTLSDEQLKSFEGLPESITNTLEFKNAAINMEPKEFNSIVEQLKKCL